jgi:lipoic acid synthetase
MDRMRKLPAWFKQELPGNQSFSVARLFSDNRINTVCREAKCPNTSRCFRDKQATFLILGKNCTRNCKFCQISNPGAEEPSLSIDAEEPSRIARAVKTLGLKYVVITSVTRDDISDGGASIFANTLKSIRRINKDIKIEVLIPDFKGRETSLKCILGAKPFIIAHNIETVSRLYPALRPESDYRLCLKVLRTLKELSLEVITKSSIMLGLGEGELEVYEALKDLRKVYCDILTLGQYLKPTPKHYSIKEFVSLEQFSKYKGIALDLGFKAVLSEPLARSSYKAEEVSICMI